MTLDTGEDQGKLFVGGLSWETTIEKLTEYFCHYGEVVDCVVMKNEESGRSRGFGFVTFKDPSGVQMVLSAGPHQLDGRTIDPKSCNAKNAQKGKREAKMSNYPKIFLGGLPPNVNETVLREFFARYGKVMEVVIMFDQEKKRTRGFGFLSFENDDAVNKVVAEHYVTIGGKKIEVKRAEPRDRSNQINNKPQPMSSNVQAAGMIVQPAGGGYGAPHGHQAMGPMAWWPPPQHQPQHAPVAALSGPNPATVQHPNPHHPPPPPAGHQVPNGVMHHPPGAYGAAWPGPAGPQTQAAYQANWPPNAYPAYPGYPYPYPHQGYAYQQAYGAGYPMGYAPYGAPGALPNPPVGAPPNVAPPPQAAQVGGPPAGMGPQAYGGGVPPGQVIPPPPPPPAQPPSNALNAAPPITQTPVVVPSGNSSAQGPVSYAQDASSYGPARVYNYGTASQAGGYGPAHVQHMGPLMVANSDAIGNGQSVGAAGYPRNPAQIQPYHPYRRM